MTYQITEIKPEFKLRKNNKNLEFILVFLDKKHMFRHRSIFLNEL